MLKTDTQERAEEHNLVNSDEEKNRTETKYELSFWDRL